MPLVQITMIEGREEAMVKSCIKAVARSGQKMLGAPLENIRVVWCIRCPRRNGA